MNEYLRFCERLHILTHCIVFKRERERERERRKGEGREREREREQNRQ